MLTSDQNSLEFLDILAIASFIIQLSNQSKLVTIQDIRGDNERAVSEIKRILDQHETKLDKIIEVISNGESV